VPDSLKVPWQPKEVKEGDGVWKGSRQQEEPISSPCENLTQSGVLTCCGLGYKTMRELDPVLCMFLGYVCEVTARVKQRKNPETQLSEMLRANRSGT